MIKRENYRAREVEKERGSEREKVEKEKEESRQTKRDK